MSEKEFTLWLMPEKNLYHELKQEIVHLSKKYSAPLFEPHITLLGDIEGSKKEVEEKTLELIKKTRPFAITLEKTGYGNTFFQCLFITVKKTSALLEANQQTRKLFGRESDPPFFPHLSLLYGNFRLSQREKIVAKEKSSYNKKMTVGKIFLAYSSSTIAPKDWRILEEFPLQ